LRAFSFGELGDLVHVDLMHVPLYSLAGKTVSTVAFQHVDVAEEDRRNHSLAGIAAALQLSQPTFLTDNLSLARAAAANLLTDPHVL
jgi:hypothetical protein